MDVDCTRRTSLWNSSFQQIMACPVEVWSKALAAEKKNGVNVLGAAAKFWKEYKTALVSDYGSKFMWQYKESERVNAFEQTADTLLEFDNLTINNIQTH